MNLFSRVKTRNREADKALADYYGTCSIRRDVVGGQRGYTVTLPNGIRKFENSIGNAFRLQMRALGHSEDRDVLVIGDPENHSSW
jgi:hypothetical protein